MRRLAWLVLTGVLASFPLSSISYYVIELRGGSHIYATDAPVRKGRLTLFHRYPDGVYVSLGSSEVVRVETSREPPPLTARKFQPGDTLYIGSALQGPGYVSSQPPAPADAGVSPDDGYGYGGFTGYGWGGYAPPPRPGPPPAPVRTNIGPNGFPILAPPGSPGSVPPAIGPNGFPIIAPQPPVASPRRP